MLVLKAVLYFSKSLDAVAKNKMLRCECPCDLIAQSKAEGLLSYSPGNTPEKDIHLPMRPVRT